MYDDDLQIAYWDARHVHAVRRQTIADSFFFLLPPSDIFLHRKNWTVDITTRSSEEPVVQFLQTKKNKL